MSSHFSDIWHQEGKQFDDWQPDVRTQNIAHTSTRKTHAILCKAQWFWSENEEVRISFIFPLFNPSCDARNQNGTHLNLNADILKMKPLPYKCLP